MGRVGVCNFRFFLELPVVLKEYKDEIVAEIIHYFSSICVSLEIFLILKIF